MKRMYLLLRLDLSEIYRAVQGYHALAAFAIEHPDEFREWSNGDISALGVTHVKTLREYENSLSYQKCCYSVWSEPDLDNQEAAIACYADAMFGNFKSLSSV